MQYDILPDGYEKIQEMVTGSNGEAEARVTGVHCKALSSALNLNLGEITSTWKTPRYRYGTGTDRFVNYTLLGFSS